MVVDFFHFRPCHSVIDDTLHQRPHDAKLLDQTVQGLLHEPRCFALHNAKVPDQNSRTQHYAVILLVFAIVLVSLFLRMAPLHLFVDFVWAPPIGRQTIPISGT